MKRRQVIRAFWQKGIFRFRLKSFRLGATLSLRRFSVAEAALLLMLALLASRGLGVVRQSFFNVLFGTGPEASAYYAASRLPDTEVEFTIKREPSPRSCGGIASVGMSQWTSPPANPTPTVDSTRTLL